MPAVFLRHFKKYFQVAKKKPGLRASFLSLFRRSWETVKAVEDISFTIEEGEMVGFIGPNGAGKTTTLKTLAGLLYPSAGEVLVLGYRPFERKPQFLKKISFLAGQKNQLWWDLPAMDTFRLNKEIYEIKEKDFSATLHELVRLLQVENLLHIPVRQLSLGERMKMELIVSLLHRPQVLFLDEPTIGLDVVMQQTIRDFLAAYNQRFHATILLTSHYIADVRKICPRVIIIDHGRILYDGNFSSLVKKYANYKILSFTLLKRVSWERLSSLGEIKKCDDKKIVISVPQNLVKKVAAFLLQNFPVEDLTIQEPEIEEIIRLIFSQKTK